MIQEYIRHIIGQMSIGVTRVMRTIKISMGRKIKKKKVKQIDRELIHIYWDEENHPKFKR
jgi:hypothetical protein